MEIKIERQKVNITLALDLAEIRYLHKVLSKYYNDNFVDEDEDWADDDSEEIFTVVKNLKAALEELLPAPPPKAPSPPVNKGVDDEDYDDDDDDDDDEPPVKKKPKRMKVRKCPACGGDNHTGHQRLCKRIGDPI